MDSKQFPKSTVCVFLFIVLFIVYLGSGWRMSGDSLWAVPTAISIIESGDATLDEFEPLLTNTNGYATIEYEGATYNLFPIGSSIIAIPFVIVVDWFAANVFSIDIGQMAAERPMTGVEAFIVSSIVAATGVVLFLVFMERLKPYEALALTVVFALGTSAWSTAARVLWQHGPSMLLLTIALLLYLRLAKAQNPGRILVLLGFTVAASYVIRPTNSLTVVIFSALLLLQYRQRTIYYFAGAALIAVPFITYNLTVYDNLLPPYFQSSRVRLSAQFGEAFLGNLISPNRGLFVFSPIMLFVFVGVYVGWRQRIFRAVDYALLIIVFLHLITISMFPHWWGGFSFGPRFFTDMLPFLFFLMAPAVVLLRQLRGLASGVAIFLFILSGSTSIFIHAQGALYTETNEWNGKPLHINQFPQRIWDTSDLQFLRSAVQEVRYGFRIQQHRFELNHLDASILISGWGNVENIGEGINFRWIEAESAYLEIPLQMTQNMTIEVGGITSMQPAQVEDLAILVNGQSLTLEKTVNPDGSFLVMGVIPQDALAADPGATQLQFSVGTLFSPAEIGLSDDPRQLGIAVDYIAFDTTD